MVKTTIVNNKEEIMFVKIYLITFEFNVELNYFKTILSGAW